MKRFKALYPRLGLVVAGIALGLIARQVFGPPDDDTRPPLSIDRPIAADLELDAVDSSYVPLNLPVEKLEP